MDIRLTRRQLRQTLREMGVHYPADANEDELKQILERENSRRWLERARQVTKEGRQVIRKRRPGHAPDDDSTGQMPAIGRRSAAPDPVGRNSEPGSSGRPDAAMRQKPGPVASDPDSDIPAHNPTFDPIRDVDALVLRRAAGVCELCEMTVPVDRSGSQAGLRPFSFDQSQADAVRTLKNVAALCPDCVALVRAGLDTADSKKLRRMSRRKIISKVIVSKRPKATRHRRTRK